MSQGYVCTCTVYQPSQYVYDKMKLLTDYELSFKAFIMFMSDKEGNVPPDTENETNVMIVAYSNAIAALWVPSSLSQFLVAAGYLLCIRLLSTTPETS